MLSNIFILGLRGSYKTPLAKRVAELTGKQYMDCNSWLEKKWNDFYPGQDLPSDGGHWTWKSMLQLDEDLRTEYQGEATPLVEYAGPSITEQDNVFDDIRFFRDIELLDLNDIHTNIIWVYNPAQAGRYSELEYKILSNLRYQLDMSTYRTQMQTVKITSPDMIDPTASYIKILSELKANV